MSPTELTLLGLQLVQIGVVIVLLFQTDKTDSGTRMSAPDRPVIGNSPFGRAWNNHVLRWLGAMPYTRVVDERAHHVITVRGEALLVRIGWTCTLAGGFFQIAAL